MQTYHAHEFQKLGITSTFVQDNVSQSSQGVLRGIHYQIGQPQAKLIRILRGEVFDVAVDIRRGSPTFGKWCGELLSEENRKMMYIPEGFAHGFYVLSPIAEFHYKCSDFYAQKEERGISWDDPDLAISWPLLHNVELILSERDQNWETLASRPAIDLPVYEGVPE